MRCRTSADRYVSCGPVLPIDVHVARQANIIGGNQLCTINHSPNGDEQIYYCRSVSFGPRPTHDRRPVGRSAGLGLNDDRPSADRPVPTAGLSGTYLGEPRTSAMVVLGPCKRLQHHWHSIPLWIVRPPYASVRPSVSPIISNLVYTVGEDRFDAAAPRQAVIYCSISESILCDRFDVLFVS